MHVHFSGINIHAKDPVKSFEFYKGLGLEVKEEVEPENEWYGAEFDIGGSILWIWRDNSGNSAENTGRTTITIVLKCDDMDKTYSDLTGKDYAVTAPELMFYGGREMNLTDPDGNKILFLD